MAAESEGEINQGVNPNADIRSEVIDLTDSRIITQTRSKKDPKVDKRLPVELDSFINLCSDEDTKPQPLKKRKVIPAAEVIFVSSDDEAKVSILD